MISVTLHSNLYIKMTFQDLNISKPLLNALNDLGYSTPTTIQEKGFSVILSGKDVLGIAQTGTGKTLAYLLPTLSMWKFSKQRFPQILIIVPTRELVVQVVEEVNKLTKYMNVVTVGVYGGANIRTQAAAMAEGLDVLVATPGRLRDLALKGELSLKQIKRLIIDEVDETLNLGFRPQLNAILEILPAKKQSLLFSATINEDIQNLINDYFIEPARIEAAPVGSPLENIEQSIYMLPNFFTKINLLRDLLVEKETYSKVIVFTRSRKIADQLFEEISNSFDEEIGIIHSNKAQNFRFNAVKNFQEGKHRILIATDIVSRGLDISEVSHVFNFDMPDVTENYIHRIGRTGRYDQKGNAISFIVESDLKMLQSIEDLMKMEIPRLELPIDLEISDVLTPDEMPKVSMPNVAIKTPSKEDVGPAFHEKKAKNRKVNLGSPGVRKPKKTKSRNRGAERKAALKRKKK